MIHVEVFMEYVTYLLMAIGILAFLVAAVVQVIKELPWLKQLPTSAVALAVWLSVFWDLSDVVLCVCGFYGCFCCISGGHRGLGAYSRDLAEDRI